MVRRGRSASPPPATRRSVPTRHAPAPTPNVPARTAPAAPPAPVHAAPSAVGAPQQPSMFQQMAATAGGVAVGSAVGHTIGAGITGLFSGSGDKEVAAPAASAPAQQYLANGAQPNEPQGPCTWEIKQFLQCAQGQSDLTLCEGFNEALRQCKTQHHLQ
ncbi:coiled-coil-helix-coiled-coil-helix domain-containing protein 2-like [Rhagoletis pomonella]|uniref:coiled-coil-helix-coiled-coil-helix domain-containing protein 2-like n=1 Tax=Rhagoletis pomonella TaxID=28610 RepID=UPI00178634B0|nr:coiled-coil-helix-coiled-coil-helix domain-containing protein 2-like [Rhagoletis pomonella]